MSFSGALKKDDRGPYVKWFLGLLAGSGCAVEGLICDEYFGEKGVASLKILQRELNCTQTGEVDDETFDAVARIKMIHLGTVFIAIGK